MGEVSPCPVGNVCLDEGEMKACAQVFVDAGDFFLVWSGSQLTPSSVSPESEPSVSAVENSALYCWQFFRRLWTLSRLRRSLRQKKDFDSCNSTTTC